MRILHVHSGNIFGGVERILVALAGHKQVSPEFEHVFALCFADRLSHELLAAGAKIIRLPAARISNPIDVLKVRKSLARALRNERFDLAVTHSAWGQFLFGSTIQRAGIANPFWLHTRSMGNSAMERLGQLHFPGAVISVSQWVDQSASKLFPGTPSFVVYSPLAIDRAAFANAERARTRAAFGVREDQVVILQASRMEAWKGHRVLLEALTMLTPDERWVCLTAGGVERPEEKDYLDDLKQTAQQLGISKRVRFLGKRDDVPALMMAADIYCQANLEAEGFSIAFVEAFYAGLPIVTSALGGALEIVNSNSGALVKAGDAEALRQELKRLIGDGVLRRRLGENGRQAALERCDPVRQFGELERVFRQIVARHE